VVLTTFDEDDLVLEALRSGASGFLLEDTPPDQLLEAIEVVAGGDALLHPRVTKRLIERLAVAQGLSNHESPRSCTSATPGTPSPAVSEGSWPATRDRGRARWCRRRR
jgi:DNA-binding NarL/FixJ family response regulator